MSAFFAGLAAGLLAGFLAGIAQATRLLRRNARAMRDAHQMITDQRQQIEELQRAVFDRSLTFEQANQEENS